MLSLRQRNNAGFSLVELIVVILIMGILATGATISVSIIYNADAERAATNIVAGLNEARTKAIALNDEGTHIDIEARIEQRDNGDYYLGIYRVDNTYKVNGAVPRTESLLEEKKLGNDRVSIYAAPKNSVIANAETYTLVFSDAESGTGTKVAYTFKKSTGGLVLAGTETDTGVITDANLCDVLVIGSESFRIVISPITGRCYMVD
jgi:prepilin-type N-terminal cleavage/methylation domain-containing protein